MIDLKKLKLGKRGVKRDLRTLRLARYLAEALPPPPPAAADWTGKIGPLGMMMNDRLGDCTCAAAGHLIQAWTGNAAAAPVVLPDEAILAAYEAVGGYRPGDESTDNGAVELDVLNYWRKPGGFAGSGHVLAAFTSINVLNFTEVKQGVFLFGGIYIGVALPVSAQEQTGPGKVWDVTADPATNGFGSWGGHAIIVLAYDADGLTCVTWGALQRMTWAWFSRYCDEAYALITPDWISADGDTPSGLDLATLQTDLAAIGAPQ
jgi:hypothetical protein